MIKHNVTSLIGIWGAWYGSGNIGDEAILHSIIHLFRKRLPEVEFFIISANSEKINSELKDKRIWAINFKKNPFKTIFYLSKANILLIGGGTPVYDDIIHMTFFLFLSIICKISNTKVATFAISIRQIKNRFVRFVTKVAFQFFVDKITFREEKSFEILKKQLHIEKKADVFTDPAIILDSKNTYKIDNVLEKENIKIQGRPLIIICPHYFESKGKYGKHHYDYLPDYLIENYISTLAEYAEIMCKLAYILFIPFHATQPEDDRGIIQKIMEKLTNYNDIFQLRSQYTFAEILPLFKRAELVIGTRFHSIILSVAAGVPFVSISYESKGKGLARLLDLDICFLDICNCSARLLCQKSEYILRHRNELENIILQKRDILRQEAAKNVSAVYEIV